MSDEVGVFVEVPDDKGDDENFPEGRTIEVTTGCSMSARRPRPVSLKVTLSRSTRRWVDGGATGYWSPENGWMACSEASSWRTTALAPEAV